MKIYFEVIQLGGTRYLWRLRNEKRVLARSQAIESKEEIEKEVEDIQKELKSDLPVVISER